MYKNNIFNKAYIRIVALCIFTVMFFCCLLSGNVVHGKMQNDTATFGVRVSDIEVFDGAKRKELSEGVKNSILRARQMAEIEWVSKGNFAAYYTEAFTFVDGVRYNSVPYGQPVHKGAYVGFNASIEEFAQAVNTAGSLMYLDRGENSYSYEHEGGPMKYSPYYSNDCSAYISYIWDLSGRFTTSMIAQQTVSPGAAGYDNAQFQYVGRKIEEMEVGYALNKGGSHVILIYDIVYNKSGDIIQVTTLEQTPPYMRLRVWGAGGNYGSLVDLQNMIDGSGYDIIRYTGIENVKYEKNENVPLDVPKTVNNISSPISNTAYDSKATGKAFVSGGDFTIEGYTSSDKELEGISYSIDGGKWSEAEVIEKGNTSVFKATVGFDGENEIDVTVKGVNSDGEYVIGEFTVAPEPEGYNNIVCFENFDGYNPGTVRNEIIEISTNLGEPSEASIAFSGWSMCSERVLGFEYKIDNGYWMELEADFKDNVYKHFPEFVTCNAYNSFSGGLGLAHLEDNTEHTLYIRAVTETNDVYDIGKATFTLEEETRTIFGFQISLDTYYLIITGIALVVLIIVSLIVVLIARKTKRNKKTKNAIKDEKVEDVEDIENENNNNEMDIYDEYDNSEADIDDEQ